MAVCGAVCKTLRRIAFHRRHLCSLTGAWSEVNVDDSRVQVSVDDSRVQELLMRMTGMDLDRVFLSRKEPLTLPRYKLMDSEQLKKVHAEAVSLARELLKMPPVLPERAPRGEVIERDDRLAAAIQHKMIFTDITHHKEDNSRRIVVREPNGILREATWEERDRVCQVYFPKLGRTMWLPAMLEKHHLPGLLKEDRHLHVLEVTCAQCAPDSADYIRVHEEVYEDIERRGLHDLLRFTRHFGGMVWYLMSRNRVDKLLQDMLTRQLVSDASDLVELHLLCHPNSTFATELQNKEERPADWWLIEAFCIHHQLTVEQQLLQACDHKSAQDRTEATLAS